LFRSLKASLKYFEEDTYAGKPAITSGEIGKKILDVLSQHCADTLAQLWIGHISAADCHSPVWPFKWIVLLRPVSRVFE
jgi:hypothetical protein